MKIPFTFLALFATQIIPLKAGINGRKNALVQGSLRPQLKFWRNPFGSSKAEPENPKPSITGTFRVQGTATLKNGKIELDINLGNEIAPETGLMPPAGPTTGTTIKPTASGPTSSAGSSTPSGSPTSASSTPPPVGGPTSASSSPPPVGGRTTASGTPPPATGSTSPSSTPPPVGGSTSASGTPPPAAGSTSPSSTPPPVGGSTSASGTPPPAAGSTNASSTPPPAGGSTIASGTPPPAGGSTSASSTPPPAGGSTSATGTPPPAGGSTSASSTPPPAGGSTSATGTPPPAAGSTSASSTPPPAGGSTSVPGSPTPSGPTTASTGPTPPITAPTIGTSGPTAGTSAATSAAPGSSTPPASKPSPSSTATPPAPATTKPTAPVKICITPGQVYVIIVAKGVMAAHNSVRRTHGSPALQLDEQMTCDAQHFAQQMASRGVLEHQTSSILARKRVGENIGMSCTPARNGPLSFRKIKKMVGNVAKRWYDEVCDYNFDKPNFAPRVGHFTEVVWSNSRKLGVGYAVGKNAKFPGYVCVYVVGRYRPAGNNMKSQRLEKNVKRGNFNNAYCTRRSKAPAFTLIPVDKRNQLQASYRARP